MLTGKSIHCGLLSLASICAGSFAGSAANSGEVTQSSARPNVILIITDDQGYGDFGFTGNHHVKTPVLDRLAAESVRFTNFYVSPVSAPTRSSLLTGRYSLRTGVRDTYNGGAIMASSEVTIAEILKGAGYATGHFGKWHLGDNYPCRPIDQGFDESLMHLGGGMGQPGDITTWFRGDSSYFDPVLWHNGKPRKYKGYCSDVFTDEALKFIIGNKNRPFFCYLAFNAPHTPLQVPDRYYSMYKDIDPAAGFDGPLRPVMSEKDREDARKVYAMVTSIDDNIGRMLRKLTELGIAENTVVIFMTDNGPQQRRYVAGMKGLKSSVYNGGVKVPLLLRYPGIAAGNKTIDIISAHIDILPTIAEICNVKMADNIQRDGISLMPAITGRGVAGSERELFFYWTRHNPEKYNNMALLKGNYKLVGRTDYDAPAEKFELYDLSEDPGESLSLTTKQIQHAGRLRDIMDNTLLDLMMSRNLSAPPCAIAGTANENPLVLNRNDAGGQRGIWDQEEIHGLWLVDIKAGVYDITVRFIKPVPSGGVMMIETGPLTNRKTITENNASLVQLNNVSLPDLKGDLIPFYEVGGKRIFPFSVELNRTNL